MYQVVILDPGDTGRQDRLRLTLEQRARIIGIEPVPFRYFSAQEIDSIDEGLPLSVAYFGGSTFRLAETEATRHLRKINAAILPIVEDLKNFRSIVPDTLFEINGHALDLADESLEKVADWFFQQFGLARRTRKVFISYLRRESTQVALQLFHELEKRNWRPFLDTIGVEPGVLFQPVLWDSMSDADLVILLDSPSALGSTWVKEEVARAYNLGLSVMQLVWPDHSRRPETLLCEPIYLESTHFAGDFRIDGGTPLMDPILQEIAVRAEVLRASSLATRRNRLVGEFCASARNAGLTPVVQPERNILVQGASRNYWILPIVGHPDTRDSEFAVRQAASHSADPILLVDPEGFHDERVQHIDWLNQHLPTRTLSVSKADEWAGVA